MAEVENFNKESEKIMKEGREKLFEKVMCSKKDGLRRVACCEKLWHKKRREARKREEETEKAEDEGRRNSLQ